MVGVVMIGRLALSLFMQTAKGEKVQQRHIANSLTLGAGLLALIYLLWTGTTWLGAPDVQGGWALLELYDTPGLEDAIALA